MATVNAIYDKLPVYHQMEVNNLKSILPGFVIAQCEWKANDDLLQKKFNIVGSSDTTVGTMVANGHICTLGVNSTTNVGELQKVGASTDTLMITYNDPIITFGPRRAYKFYATDTDAECVRAIILQPGDEWMSDIDYFEQESSAYVYPGATYLADRIVKISDTANKFYGKGELADGTTAYHYMFVK